jgi:hypothetical protein
MTGEMKMGGLNQQEETEKPRKKGDTLAKREKRRETTEKSEKKENVF